MVVLFNVVLKRLHKKVNRLRIRTDVFLRGCCDGIRQQNHLSTPTTTCRLLRLVIFFFFPEHVIFLPGKS